MDNNNKANDAEIEKRIGIIYEMVVKGASHKFIVRYCSENFKISSRQTENYLKRVKDEIKTIFGESYKKDLISKSMAQLDDLYMKNYTIEDFRECRNLIETRNKMLGLNSATKIDLESTSISINLNLGE